MKLYKVSGQGWHGAWLDNRKDLQQESRVDDGVRAVYASTGLAVEGAGSVA